MISQMHRDSCPLLDETRRISDSQADFRTETLSIWYLSMKLDNKKCCERSATSSEEQKRNLPPRQRVEDLATPVYHPRALRDPESQTHTSVYAQAYTHTHTPKTVSTRAPLDTHARHTHTQHRDMHGTDDTPVGDTAEEKGHNFLPVRAIGVRGRCHHQMPPCRHVHSRSQDFTQEAKHIGDFV